MSPVYLNILIFCRRPGDIVESKWWIVSGAEITEKCGILLDGSSLHFIGHGLRQAVTSDLDLTMTR